MQVSEPPQKEPQAPRPAAVQPKGLDDKLGAIPAAGADDGMKKGAKIKLYSKAVPSTAPPKADAPAKELAQYEREVKVDAALDKCLVCKRDLVGDVYICPSCKAAKYHGACVQALIASNEPCWGCKRPFAENEAVIDKASVEQEIRGIDEMLAAMDDQSKQHKLSPETFKKRSDQFVKEKEALEKKLKKFDYR